MNEPTAGPATRTGMTALSLDAILRPAPKPTVSVLVAVAIPADAPPKLFSHDAATSGDPHLTAKRLLSRAAEQARDWCAIPARVHGIDSFVVHDTGRTVVMVAAQVVVDEHIATTDTTTVTTCDPHYTADGLITAALQELTEWLNEQNPATQAAEDAVEADEDEEANAHHS